MRRLVILLLSSFVFLGSCAEWDEYNDPNQFGSGYILNAQQLPQEGRLKRPPWSDTYWPSFLSGIAHRWMSSRPNDFDYKLYSQNELQNLSLEQMKELSPAEKYDIYTGRYDYPTVKSEWQRTSPNDATWEGLCHGWAPASLMFDQPQPVTLQNKDGIKIPFGSSDIKALLIYFMAEYNQRSNTPFLSQRCQQDLKEHPEYQNEAACADMNAGTFHIVIANQIGNLKMGFVVDRDRSIEVWNQPVFYFSTSIEETRAPSAGASRATVKELKVKTSMAYGKETKPEWDAHDPLIINEEYEYWVEIDSQGNVIGGHHETWDRPDFAWKEEDSVSFTGYFASLQKIYEASTSTSDTPSVNLPPRTLAAAHPTVRLVDQTGTFGVTAGDHNHTRHSQYKKSWSIVPQQGADKIIFTFQYLSTERHREKVKIYEGATGEGALVAVLHGTQAQMPLEIVLSSGSAFVLYEEDRYRGSSGNAGFLATYTAVNSSD